MGGFYFLVPTFLVVFTSFLIVKAATIALMMTGVDANKAQFQALSAFSGTGFTTKEAESIVNEPIRRKIVTWLMILGNAGVVTVIVTATSTLVSSNGYNLPLNALILVAGLYVIYKIVSLKGFSRRWEHYIEKKLVKSKAFEEGDTEDLLHLLEGHVLLRVIIQDNSALMDKSLKEARLTEQGMIVLGIERGRHWMSIPRADETIREGDRLVVYGSPDILKSTFSKKAA
ncbi:MAG: TrkA C-terminal domain-containing protein [Thermodesulfobacteriota bacterium]|nr:MAG: TrkA C-terminal domain-containing protein [Thermodesulfobacteriota bacterium]